MFRLEPPEKIPRKAENKIMKRSVKTERNWRPGPQPTKPDHEVILLYLQKLRELNCEFLWIRFETFSKEDS